MELAEVFIALAYFAGGVSTLLCVGLLQGNLTYQFVGFWGLSIIFVIGFTIFGTTKVASHD